MAAIELYSTPLFDDANLRAYYRFETGALTTDSKGSYTLTNNNTVGEDTGKFGVGADFGDANTNKYFSIADDYGLPATGNLSISFWVKLNANPAGTNLFNFFQVGIVDAYMSYLWMDYGDNVGTVQFKWARYNGAVQQCFTTLTMGTTNWHHIVLTYDGTTLTGYYDGAYSNSVASAPGTFAAGSPISTIGCNVSPANFSSCVIDDLALFDRVLTPTEIGNLYNGTWATEHHVELSDSVEIIENVATSWVSKISFEDSLSIVEQWTNTTSVGWTETPSDSISLVEVLANSFSKKIIDSLDIAEGITGISTEKSLSDTVSFADGLVLVSGFKLALSDSIDIAESVVSQTALKVSDIIGVTAEGISKVAIDKALSDSITFAEAVVNSLGKKVVDSISIAEVVANQATLRLSDSISITENAVAFWVSERSLEDSISFSEGLATKLVLALSDGIGMGEEAALAWVSKVAVADTISFAESLMAGNEFVLGLSDSIILSETLIKFIGKFETDYACIDIYEELSLDIGLHLSDSLYIADEDVVESFVESLGDTVSIDESERSSTVSKKRDDLVLFSDIGLSKGSFKNIVDNIEFSESLVSLKERTVTLSDSVDFSESLTKRVRRSLTASMDTFDELAKGVVSSLQDMLPIAEAVGNKTTLSLSDDIDLFADILAGGYRTLSEKETMSEELYKSIFRVMEDDVVISEETTRSYFLVLADSLSIVEQLATGKSLDISDLISFTEGLELLSEFYYGLSDLEGADESTEKTVIKILFDVVDFSDVGLEKKVKHLEESVTLVEEISVKRIAKDLSDSESIADSEGAGLLLVLGDSVEVTETSTRLAYQFVALSDSIGVGETSTFDVAISLVDGILFNEGIEGAQFLSLSDGMEISEEETTAFVKDISDSVSFLESLVCSVATELSDSATVSEAFSGRSEKALSDSVSVAESYVWRQSKFLIESLDLDEVSVRSVWKAVTDSIEITEERLTANDFCRELTENVSISDGVGSKIVLPFTESVSISEDFTKRLVINKTETQAIAETMDTGVWYVPRIGQMAFLRTEGQMAFLRMAGQ